MLDQLTGIQLGEWEAYDRIEPVGEYRRDYRIASLTAMIYNVASSFGSGKHGKRKVAKPQDFMAWLDSKPPEKTEKQSVSEMKKALYLIASSADPKKKKKKLFQRKAKNG